MIALADYLLTRLKQLGIKSVFGLPGDFNLELLDHVEDSGLTWMTNCNELNAGYAADGYARVKGAAALITTFGVGELSAMNAIAGAYSELAPVIHIVGTPARSVIESRALVHHALNDGGYDHFARMSEHVTVAQAILQDPRTCPAQIDHAIQQCMLHSRPVYITLPADMVKTPVDDTALGTPISLPKLIVRNDVEAEAFKLIMDRISASKLPYILVDGESRAFGILALIDRFVRLCGWPTWTSTFGKGFVNEQLENVFGTWQGRYSPQDHQEYIDSADLVLCFGPHFSSTNTYQYSTVPKDKATIFFLANAVKADGKTFRDVSPISLLEKLISRNSASSIRKAVQLPRRPSTTTNLTEEQLAVPVTQEQYYAFLNQYLRPGDIIFGETGTAGYGCRDLVLPEGCRITLPATWLSIGYMLPAALGAAAAQRELHVNEQWHTGGRPECPRTICIIGDGSLQLTVQEISTMLQQKLNIVIMVINNHGYTIEKCIHGWDRAYNDVASWRFLEAPSFFGASMDKQAEYPVETAQIRTYSDAHTFFGVPKHATKAGFKMLEVIMDPLDAPRPVLDLLAAQKK